MICNVEEVQAHLPQLIIVSEKTVPLYVSREISKQLPVNVHLLRAKSHWMTAELFERLICLLHVCLAPFLDRFYPVVTFDSAKQHLSKEVFRTLKRLRMPAAVVPAKCTWLLQPLDVVSFAIFKRFLKAKLRESRLRTALGNISKLEWLRGVLAAIREVLCGRPWADAFKRTGVALNQLCVSDFIMRNLQLDSLPAASSAPLTAHQLKLVLPIHTVINVDLFLGPCEAAPLLALPAPLHIPAARLTLMDIVEDEPITHRLRSHSRSLLRAASVVGSSVPLGSAEASSSSVPAPQCVRAGARWPMVRFLATAPALPALQRPALTISTTTVMDPAASSSRAMASREK